MKKILALLLTLVMTLSLVACGGSEEPASESAPSASEEAPAEEAPAEEAAEETGEKTWTPSGQTMNVGVQSNIISIPTVYAFEQGYYEELGLDVNLRTKVLRQGSWILPPTVLPPYTLWPPVCVTGSENPTAAPQLWLCICVLIVKHFSTRVRSKASQICTEAQRA